MFYRIHVTLLRNALLFEIGLARLDAVHNSFYVGSQTFAWSFSAERCNDHKQVSFECMSREERNRVFWISEPQTSVPMGCVCKVHDVILY